MSTSPETKVLRGLLAERAPLARVASELRTSRYLKGAKADPRLFDPDLERAFDELTEVVRANAAAEGFADGYASGRLQAVADVRLELAREVDAVQTLEAERRASTERLLAALGTAIDDLESRILPTYEDVADRLGEVAYTLVEAILGRELALSHELALDAVRRVCATAGSGADFTLWLNPLDLAALAGLDVASIVGRQVELLADSTLAPGDARAESGATRVDARLTSALARVREVLTG